MDKIIVEQFPDIFHFLDAIETRPTCPGMYEQSRNNNNEFAGMSYNDAMNACRQGMADKKDVLENAVTTFAATVKTGAKFDNYYYGYAPNVPRAIIGHPKSMRRRTTQPKKVKTVHVIYNATANADVDADMIEHASIATLNTIYTLERAGYRCKFTMVDYCAKAREEVAILTINLKEYNQPFDFLKLSFPLTQVAMFRRLGFRWIETRSGITAEWWSIGYGRSCGDTADELRKSCANSITDTTNALWLTVNDWKKTGYNVSTMLNKTNLS